MQKLTETSNYLDRPEPHNPIKILEPDENIAAKLRADVEEALLAASETSSSAPNPGSSEKTNPFREPPHNPIRFLESDDVVTAKIKATMEEALLAEKLEKESTEGTAPKFSKVNEQEAVVEPDPGSPQKSTLAMELMEDSSDGFVPDFCKVTEEAPVTESASASTAPALSPGAASFEQATSLVPRAEPQYAATLYNGMGTVHGAVSPGLSHVSQRPLTQRQSSQAQPAQKQDSLPPLSLEKIKAYDVAAELCSVLPIAMVDEALYVFTGKAYEFVTGERMNRLIMAHCRAYVQATGNATIIRQIFDILKAEPSICRPNLQQEDLVALDNGLLSLRDFSLAPHTPEVFVTAQILGQFRPDLPLSCPQFDRFLDTIAQGDPELIQRIWEAIGYSLVPDGRGKCAIVFQGVKDSGKSLLGVVIASCFPPGLVTSLSMDDMGERGGPAELVGKSLCTSMDLSAGLWDTRSTGVLKTLTGGDMLTADVKYQPRIRFRNTAKLLFGTNHAIGTKAQDDALMRRLVVVPFGHSVPLEEQDHDLKAKLLYERDAIITKALLAYRDLRQRNYRFSGEFQLNQVVAAAPMSFVGGFNLDQAVADFCETYCSVDANARAFSNDLYEAFLAVTPGAQGNVTIAAFSAKLSRYLTDNHPGAWRKDRARKHANSNPQSCYQGISLMTSGDGR